MSVRRIPTTRRSVAETARYYRSLGWPVAAALAAACADRPADRATLTEEYSAYRQTGRSYAQSVALARIQSEE